MEARNRGWNPVIVGITAGLQHLTVISLGLLCAYLVCVIWAMPDTAAQLVPVVMPLQSCVGILYWTLALYDPWLLFPRGGFPKDSKIANALVRMFTVWPSTKYPLTPFMWVLLHQQHTLAPLHLWVEAYNGLLPSPDLSLTAECCVALSAALAYHVFNMFCWHVRQLPAYPVQTLLQKGGGATIFYVACVVTLLLSQITGYQLRSSMHTGPKMAT